jgi:hypothetical protein
MPVSAFSAFRAGPKPAPIEPPRARCGDPISGLRKALSLSGAAEVLGRYVMEITARVLQSPYVEARHHLWVRREPAAFRKRPPAAIRQKSGAVMYSIIVLICSTALSHAECQAKTAVDVVRGPTVDNPMMCAFNAQTMIARTDLVQNNGAEYVKVVCTRTQNAEQWMAEISARKAAIQ